MPQPKQEITKISICKNNLKFFPIPLLVPISSPPFLIRPLIILKGTKEYQIYRKKPAQRFQKISNQLFDNIFDKKINFDNAMPLQNYAPILNNKNENNEQTCPDKKSKCPAHTTCCPLNNNNKDDKNLDAYGCCPAEEAVCCEDKLHCCPHNTKCDIVLSRCTNTKVKFYLIYKRFV